VTLVEFTYSLHKLALKVYFVQRRQLYSSLFDSPEFCFTKELVVVREGSQTFSIDSLAQIFLLEKMLKMLISENERFCQDINADRRQGLTFSSFLARFRRTKPIPSF
jgi:hypothetical protein